MTPQTPAGDVDLILNHTEAFWKELRNERLFITGGTGFFGRWILESLIRANERLGAGPEAFGPLWFLAPVMMTSSPSGTDQPKEKFARKYRAKNPAALHFFWRLAAGARSRA